MSASTKESLQDQLDRITQNTRALVQPERLAISEKATADLFNTGIEDRVLKVGEQIDTNMEALKFARKQRFPERSAVLPDTEEPRSTPSDEKAATEAFLRKNRAHDIASVSEVDDLPHIPESPEEEQRLVDAFVKELERGFARERIGQKSSSLKALRDALARGKR